MQLNSRMSAKQWTDSSTFPEPPEYDDLDDARVLRYLFRNFAPRRHLEFGTWKGKGARRVLEECEDAVVWTVNLWEGEYKQDGTWAYAGKQDGKKVRTDAGGMIGIEYLQAGLGNRVNQIYSDSRLWDDTVYPDGFFDSVFVDGGHDAETSRADLYKALRLLRPGGLLLLHDFSPSGEVHAQFPSTAGVSCMVAEELENIAACCEEFFHVEDTWLFCAIRRREATGEQALREVELIREASAVKQGETVKAYKRQIKREAEIRYIARCVRTKRDAQHPALVNREIRVE